MELSIPDNEHLTSGELLGRILVLTWTDGHRSELPLDALRRACPCATCGDSGPAKSRSPLHVLAPTAPSEVRDIQAVGLYALQFFWSDGHETGIYSFELLRALCECPECSRSPDQSAS